MDNLKSFMLSAFSSSPAFIYAAVENINWLTITSTLVLPCVFFVLSKTIDIYLQKRKNR
ncbi:MAG: hypothetical protein LUM44_09910 [Pyrinomonadaceae bacterium]|nr:hypothetical protein [Pyrinomonadaceae bacterium]